MGVEHISLRELNGMVRDAVENSVGGPVWVVGEVSELRVAANGHCYLTLVERERGKIVARADAHIWSNRFIFLRDEFEQTAGVLLQAGISILVAAEPTFHEQYGYSLNILDIDPAYTLGEAAKRRQEIVRRLEADGVFDLNRDLALARPLLRIAVVSAETAAGYGDFCQQLSASPFAFTTRLFPAIMQGVRTADSIIAALADIAAEEADWDAVAIIRGGGAVSDLDGYESYDLAAAVAQFPLPVLTGIGHERDETVVDLVANTRLKTPTAVAAFLIDLAQEEWDAVGELADRLREGVRLRLQNERRRFDGLAHRLQLSVARHNADELSRLQRLRHRLAMAAQTRLQTERGSLEPLRRRLAYGAQTQLERSRQTLAAAERLLRMAGPERILHLGFSITTLDGRPVRDAKALKRGDVLKTQFEKGTIESTVS